MVLPPLSTVRAGGWGVQPRRSSSCIIALKPFKYEGRLHFCSISSAKLWMKHPGFCTLYTVIALNKTKGHTRKRIVIAIVMPILSVTPAWLISEHDLKKKKEEKSSGVILNPPRYMRCPWCMCNYSIITEIITVWARLITLLAKMVHF